jgi:dTDP-4-amino-4,6-dideoxygalactose transaminase
MDKNKNAQNLNMHIPFVDLKIQYQSIKEEINAEIQNILDSTAFICGERVLRFEGAFAKAHRAKYCLGLSSGTDALHLALWVLGIKQGDEVIVPVNTYIASSEVISLTGAKPVFVDHDEDSFNIDVKLIEKAITSRTKAIIAVHLYGQSADMDAILEIAKKYNLFLIEDCAQAHLAEYKGQKVGNFGVIGCFSFYPGKNLGAYGEAGAVITNNEEFYQKMLRLRQHGAIAKYYHDVEGHNYRMEEIQAAVLYVKLKYLERWTELRRKVAEQYSMFLKGVRGISAPKEMPYTKHVYHLFVIRSMMRDKLKDFLGNKSIETGLHYPLPLHLQKAYQYLGYKVGDFPIAEKCCQEILSLPMFPEMTEDQLKFVTDTIQRFSGS